MSELDPLDQQLALAWRELSPPGSLEARVRARLVTGGGVSAGVSTVTRAASRVRALRASGSLGAGVGCALLLLGFIAGYWARPSATVSVLEHPAAPAVIAPVDPVASVASVEPVASVDSVDAIAPEATPDPKTASVQRPDSSNGARESSRPRARSQRPPAASPDTGRALSLLARAERAVRAKNPELALALIRSFDDLRPGAALNEERNAIELMARCQERDPSALALKQAFAKRYPESVYVERIEGECTSPPTTPAASTRMPASPTRAPATDINIDEGGNHAQSETN
jgi:hypothetical protein